jgi:hypothetical protein
LRGDGAFALHLNIKVLLAQGEFTLMKHRYLSNNIHVKAVKIALIFVAYCLASGCAIAQQSKSTFAADSHTIMLLQPGVNGTMTDQTQTFEPVVKGAETVNDSRFGKVLQFGDKDGNGITVKDDGKMDFSDGLTLEMWLLLPDSKPYSGNLFQKRGSFAAVLSENRIDVTNMDFPTVPVATDTPQQLKYYPVGSYGFHGNLPLASMHWAHVAVTYDPVVKVIRTWIDGDLDRSSYLVQQGKMPLENDETKSLSILDGMKNVRVAGIRVSDIARDINNLPPMETYVNALPYRNQIAVIFDHINPKAGPLDVVLQWELPIGTTPSVLQRFTLENTTRKDIVFTPLGWKNDIYTLIITAYSQNKLVYSRIARVMNQDLTTQPTRIDKQNRFIMDGKPVFPLMIYDAFKEDFPEMAKLGFNIVYPRSPDSTFMEFNPRDAKDIATMHDYLESAANNNIGISFGTKTRAILEFRDKPGLSLWYGADEPWGHLQRLIDNYNRVKLFAPNAPVFIVQNNRTRFQETAEGADILACDPYPIPSVSLRDVVDATKSAIAAVGGLKPVWTILPQYQSKRPTEQELRCMAYLAIVSGANGLGIYAWDMRNSTTKVGYYTKEHPQDAKILADVVGELDKLQDVLTIPNSSREYTLTPANPALHVAMKESGNDSYLFVVNDSRAAQGATLSIAGLQSADGVDIHDASQKLSIRDGKVLLQLPPLGVRVYKLANIQNGG